MKYNRLHHRTIRAAVFLAALTFLSAGLQPASAESTDGTSWVIAAAPFSGSSDLSEILPSLILNALPDTLEHTVDDTEQLERKRSELKKELPALVTAMNTLIARRDAVVLSSDSQWKKEQTIADLDTQIADARQKVEDSLSLASLETYEPEDNLREKVALYKQNTASLMQVSGGETAAELESLAAREGIQALLQGSVFENGKYLYVSVTVLSFPGCRQIGSVESVYPVTSANLLSDEIAQKLLDVLENKETVSIALDVLNAAEKVTVHLDGVPLVNWTQGFSTQAGMHHITVESPGRLTQGFTYDFSEANRYVVQVRMKPSENLQLAITSVQGGSVYLSGGSVASSGAYVQVNGLPVLGETISPDGVSTFFIVDQKPPLFSRLTGASAPPVPPGSNLTASVASNTGNTTELIDKRRRSMYTSFGLFLLSLPVSFYCYGRAGDYAAQIDGRYNQAMTPENQALWDGYTAWSGRAVFSMTISGGLAANWLFQLGRYIMAADQVLPRQVYVEPDAESSKIE